MPDLAWRKSLGQIVGPQNVTTDAAAIRQRPWEGSLPNAMAFPDTREQVGELIRLADAERLKVVPVGHGTKLRLGGVLQPVDLVISLERLNKITDYPASDLTISVEAGVSVRELASTLAAKGQMLPLEVPFADHGTVGGTIATNLNGPRRLACGTWRDIVLGMQYVTAEGQFAKGGGKVVKNVAGYDIPKLLIGSLGTVGILFEITFKVFPIPPNSATIALNFRSAAEACQAALRILHSPLLPQALDLVDSPAALAGSAVRHRAPFTLLAGVAGLERVLARFEHELPALVRVDGLESFEVFREDREGDLWKAVQEMTPAFLDTHPQGMVVKASLPLTCMGDFMSQAHPACEQHGLSQATLARAGNGIVYVYLWPEPGTGDEATDAALRAASELLIRQAEQLGGRAIVEWSPPELKSKLNLWGTLGDDFASMRELKAALDPKHILSPGRFYGGI